MREQAVEALSWFLPDSLAELIGFMADSNPEVLEDVMKNFTEGIDDAELSDRELAAIFKKVAPIIEDDDAIDVDLQADAPIEQTGQSTELLSGDPSSEDPVDLGDWEPTLF
jgi:ABC-type nitrate/sulfonate/bicarbonate transport system substrate-binding protein